MSEVFFLSYARRREDTEKPETLQPADYNYLEYYFYTRLAEQVKVNLGFHTSISFWDSCNLEAGTADWVSEINKNILKHPIGVVLESTSYAGKDRPWCYWEYKFLEDRNTEVSRRLANEQVKVPRLLFTLNWVEIPSTQAPPKFSSLAQKTGESIANGNPDHMALVREVLDTGLRNLVERAEIGDTASKVKLTTYIQLLAEAIASAWRNYDEIKSRLGNLTPPPPFNNCENWWAPRSETKIQVSRKVYVLYLATRPELVPAERAYHYEAVGEGDWKPFVGQPQDSDEPVTQILKHVTINEAAHRYLSIQQWELDNFDALKNNYLDQWNYPVIFIVDPYTCGLADHSKQLLDYAEALANRTACGAPLLIWNEADQDTTPLCNTFLNNFQSKFGSTIDIAQTSNELRQLFGQKVVALQNTIRLRKTSSMPSTGSSLVKISAQ